MVPNACSIATKANYEATYISNTQLIHVCLAVAHHRWFVWIVVRLSMEIMQSKTRMKWQLVEEWFVITLMLSSMATLMP